MSETPSLHITRREETREALGRILEPLEAQLEKIESDLVQLEEARADLIAQRGEILPVLRRFLPDKYPGKAYKAKSKPAPKATAPGEAVEELREWLTSHRSQLADGFWGTDLRKRPGFPLAEKAVHPALATLADQGFIRLDRIGNGQRGGAQAKVYKLTRAAAEE